MDQKFKVFFRYTMTSRLALATLYSISNNTISEPPKYWLHECIPAVSHKFSLDVSRIHVVVVLVVSISQAL